MLNIDSLNLHYFFSKFKDIQIFHEDTNVLENFKNVFFNLKGGAESGKKIRDSVYTNFTNVDSKVLDESNPRLLSEGREVTTSAQTDNLTNSLKLRKSLEILDKSISCDEEEISYKKKISGDSSQALEKRDELLTEGKFILDKTAKFQNEDLMRNYEK
jgi:hypothetical protein